MQNKATHLSSGGAKIPALDSFGSVVGKIPVQLGANFLAHFSEQLYSSPNKAFEELVANSWDAGAQTVWIRFPDDLSDPTASILVLDDGESMDAEGLQILWQVAHSNKRSTPAVHGRPPIGKFGIGKLATYVLANKLTYVCKASDGVIRAVTMDYGSIRPSGKKPVFIQNLSLNLRKVDMAEVLQVLASLNHGKEIVGLFEKGLPPPPKEATWEDEFGGPKPGAPKPSGCWTLAVLSDLKERGREVKQGILRRMLQTSLPLGAELKIVLNGELLGSSKDTTEVKKEWIIGPELNITSLNLASEDETSSSQSEEVKVKALGGERPHIILPGLGPVYGRIKLYVGKISGGKSEDIGSSNGFYLNVLGRIVNRDATFGEKDLSHSAWARFRMTVRVDGLDEFLAVNREQFSDAKELRIFRAFLRKGFNMARTEYDAFVNAAWSDSGSAIIRAYGTLPVSPVRELISQTLAGNPPVSGLVDDSGLGERKEALTKWQQETNADAREVIRQVGFEECPPDKGLAVYRVRERGLVVNANHPFVQEHSATNEQKIVIRNMALLDFLSDVHTLDIGVEPSKLEDIRHHRDSMARLIAKISRRSGAQIAKLLIEVGTYKEPKAFEIIVGDALEYLGFHVKRLATPGEPEGIAYAYPTPSLSAARETYSFTYDAKSSKTGKVKTGDVRASGLARHRDNHSANHILVVAPEFESGALEKECKASGVTPMRAAQLGQLLLSAAEFGAIPLTKLRELFNLNDPNDVAEWVANLNAWLKTQRVLTLEVFIKALQTVEKEIPDTLAAALLAEHCRKIAGSKQITEFSVIDVARGLQIVVPDLVRVDNKSIVLSAHPQKLVEAIKTQLDALKGASAANPQ